jgi:drug/metabolite transporter (DMT)-like permease
VSSPASVARAPAARSGARTVSLAAAALACFAANSLLCRAALGADRIDPGAFTAVRLGAGAVALAALLAVSRRTRPAGGSWGSALALFAYAATFSLAYVRIRAGVGALVLFALVQASMVGYGVATGATLGLRGWAGGALATAGLAGLTLPGAEAPDAAGVVLMALAGLAWGVYSLRGRRATDPLATTADNFVRAAPPGRAPPRASGYSPRYTFRTSGEARSSLPVPRITTVPVSRT